MIIRYPDGGWTLSIPMFFGRLNIKPLREPQLYSERYGFVPTLDVAGYRFVWRKARAITPRP